MQSSYPILASLLLAASAHACSIPVFRYALDRWHADKYRLEVSAEDAKDEKVARFLRNFTDSTPINVEIARVPGSSRLVFPHADTVWTGALPTALATLTDSPARAEIVRRILDGENGVWVLVGDADTAPLEKRLRYLEQVAQLPHIDPNDPTSKLGPGPALRVKFSLLRLRADDPAEQPFLKMLAGPKSAPAGAWLALVFGRGRVLGAWPAEGFGDEQIDEACLFLLGACSCEVKRLNPGWDLLLDADWDEKLRAIGFPAASAAVAPAKPVESAPETVMIEPAGPAAAQLASTAQSGIDWNNAGTVIATFALICAMWWMIRRKP